MKALVLYGPGKYRVESNWEKPIVKEGWALIKVGYCGICGSDIPRFISTGSYHHPIILGHEFSGQIEEVSSKHRQFKKGDRVAILPIINCGKCNGCKSNGPFHCTNYNFLGSRTDGGFAEYCIVPERNLFLLPDNLDLAHGALIEPIAVALHAVRQSGFQADQKAIVFGCGPIGLLIGMWLRILGAKTITLVDVRDESLTIARKMGFTSTINASKDSISNIREEFDTAFEASGSGKALWDSITCVGNKGIITVVGRNTEDTNIPLRLFEQFMRKELKLGGSFGYNLTNESEFIYEHLEEHDFPLEHLITHEITLSRAPDTIRKMHNQEMYYCKVLIRMS